ncbi:MAG: PDZ domain-containing protein [Chloroflexia bacterium]|nr:PDZ domain-containing protein [Chloroflexia bacterium]
MRKTIFFLFLTTYSFILHAQTEAVFARFPAVSPDGKQITFSFQGDIWVSSIDGSLARRITIHQGYESNPKWSPDGKQIAFSSNRFGNDDIFVIDANGGIPKRITYHSSDDNLTDWTKNGDLLFESNRNYQQVERDFELQRVSFEGGTPTRLMDAFGSEPVQSPNGKFIAFVMGGCRIAREQYQGSANKDIWLYNSENKEFIQITNYKGQDYHPVWGSNSQLYFISARSGKYNVFSVQLDENGKVNSEPKQITSEQENEVRFFDVSIDNQTIVFEKDVNLYRISTTGGNATKIILTIATDYRFDPYENKTFNSEIDEYQVSPNGKYTAFIIHGEVFISENDKKKSLTKNMSNSSAREKDVCWLNDSVLIFSSDKDGKYDLYLTKSTDNKQYNLFKTLKQTIVKISNNQQDEHSAEVSPDGKKIAFVRGGNFGKMSFIVADIDKNGSISNEKVLQDGWSKPEGIQWSPDSKWLAYSMEDLTFNSEVYIQKADGSAKEVNISMHPRSDFSPVWGPDGSKLGFISARNNNNNDIWYVWLKKEDYQKTKQDWEEEDEEKPEDPKEIKEETKKGKAREKDKAKKEEIKPIQIDLDLIHERLVQLTDLSGNEGNIAISKDGKTFYFSSMVPGSKGSDLFKVNWDKTEMKEVTKGGKSPRNIQVDKEGKFLYMNLKGQISRISTSGTELENLTVQAKMTINFNEELDQIFEEGWRSLRDGFYDPEYHGQNWDALKEKYKPYCMAASTKTDFMYMYNNMLGQLNASHMGLYGRDREKTQSEQTGLLGIEIKPVAEGVEIVRVVPDSPADKVSSKLYESDIIVAVNGEKVTPKISFWSLLNNAVDTKVLLNVKNKQGALREVAIRPTGNLSTELYDEWVKDRRKLVNTYSNGRLGYLHIRGMDITSFERFERELTAAGNGKEAIVIDVRFNGGGWTTDYLMAILNVKQHAYTIPRGATTTLKDNLKYRNYYPFAERLPYFVWNKPSIALCNSSSYSNAEIFSHAYKNLGIGTLVGKPTFGAVISTSAVGLIDGSFVRMPYRGWFAKATDKNMDKFPAVPDIDVDNSPDCKAKGLDEQLKRACEELLKQLDKK